MPSDAERKSVLIVEDDRFFRDSLEQALEMNGYHPMAVESPRMAMDLVEQRRPDLIISDVHFRDGDGRDLLMRLREDDAFASCPIVIMTGRTGDANFRNTMDLGADDYLEKPFTLDQFITCVKTRLMRTRAFEASSSGFLEDLRSSVSKSLPHEFLTPLNGILGFSDVLRRERLKEDDVQEMAEMVHQSGERLLRTIRNYLAILDLMEITSASNSERPVRKWTGGELWQAVEEQSMALAGDRERGGDLKLRMNLDELECYAVELDSLLVVGRELLDNALKFSKQGTRVFLQLREEDGKLKMMVTDCGTGMSEERIRQIKAFGQFDRSRYAQQGLGLGLTLVQKLLEKQVGYLQLESVSDMGTTARAVWDLRRAESDSLECVHNATSKAIREIEPSAGEAATN